MANIQTTRPLVSRFEFLLKQPGAKITSTTIALAHQGTQYLVRSGIITLTLPDYLDSYITAGTPSPRRQSRLNNLRKYLIKQNWFTQYNLTAEKTFGIYSTDGCIIEKETGLEYIFELDDIGHLEGTAEEKQDRWRWKDEIRDQWLLGLKDKDGNPVIRDVLRLPLWPPHRSDVPTLAGKIQSFVLTPPESKKQKFPVPSPVQKLTEPAEISVPQKRGPHKAKKKRSEKQAVPLVTKDMLLNAIEGKKARLPDLQLLLQRKRENLSESQRAHILIRILDIYPEERMDILEIFCQHFSAEIIGCTDQKGMSPIVRAVELKRLPAVKLFVEKSPKKIKLPHRQWEAAAELANKNHYEAIESILLKKGIKISSVRSPSIGSMKNKKESLLDSQLFSNFTGQFVDAHQLTLPLKDFINSIINDIDKFSEQQILTIALQGNTKVQKLLASLLKEKKDNEGYLYWLEKSAHGGNASAQLELGEFYFEMEAKEEKQKCIEWFRKAAEQGSAQAQANLGICYEFGVAVNHEEAIRWYLKAVENNNSLAQNNLAAYYFKGIHVKKNEQMALELYRKSAKQGYSVGQYNLGVCYNHGIGQAANPQKAIRWYKKAAKQGDPDALTKLAQHYISGRFVKKALLYCRKAVESGLEDAQFTLGMYYFELEENYKEAKKWFQKASDQNFAKAQYAIGHMYWHGLEVKKDAKEAEKWYRMAAKQNLMHAQCALGQYHKYELKNDREAEKWYRKAAIQGMFAAQCQLGNHYFTTECTERDFSIATYWFTLAAQQNLKEVEKFISLAQVCLSLCLLKSKNEIAGVYWLNQAKSRGSAVAKDILNDIKSGKFEGNTISTLFPKLFSASEQKFNINTTFERYYSIFHH